MVDRSEIISACSSNEMILTAQTVLSLRKLVITGQWNKVRILRKETENLRTHPEMERFSQKVFWVFQKRFFIELFSNCCAGCEVDDHIPLF